MSLVLKTETIEGPWQIRDLQRDDLPALLDAYAFLHPGDPKLSPEAPVPGSTQGPQASPATEPSPEPQTEAQRLDQLWERICADPSLVYLGAFVGRELASTCTAAIVPNLTRGARPYAVIENVVTHPNYRRRGIGAALIHELVSRCWAAGCYKIMLLSAAQRDAAHLFYERIGFDHEAKRAFVLRRPEGDSSPGSGPSGVG